MHNDQQNRAFAQSEIRQLKKSERGTGALKAAAQFLRDDSTYSLDGSNQAALVNIVRLALATPSIREELDPEAPKAAAPEKKPAAKKK